MASIEVPLTPKVCPHKPETHPPSNFLLPWCNLSLLGLLALLPPPPKASPCSSTSSLFPESISLGSCPLMVSFSRSCRACSCQILEATGQRLTLALKEACWGAGQGAAARQDCLSWSLGLMGC